MEIEREKIPMRKFIERSVKSITLNFPEEFRLIMYLEISSEVFLEMYERKIEAVEKLMGLDVVDLTHVTVFSCAAYTQYKKYLFRVPINHKDRKKLEVKMNITEMFQDILTVEDGIHRWMAPLKKMNKKPFPNDPIFWTTQFLHKILDN